MVMAMLLHAGKPGQAATPAARQPHLAY